MTLLDLAERLEGASGADRRLDAEIAMIRDPSLSVLPTGTGQWMVTRDGFRVREDGAVARFTSSIDAAMTLLPPNHIHSVWHPEDRVKVQTWDRTRADYCGFGVDVPEATASSYALALCAAALRARATME